MKLPELVPAIFIKRPNRFTAGVRLINGKQTTAFVPTTGRLTGALIPGCRVWLAPAENTARKTPFTMMLTELDNGGLCSVNAALANRLFAEAVGLGRLKAFDYCHIAKEVTQGQSRLDFRLSQGKDVCWVEVKSVTYVEDGIGMFPDAPTARGRKHLAELAKLAAQGSRASAVFIAQRGDAERFMPFESVDPLFAETLRKVHQQGVGVYAYRCAVSTASIEISEALAIDL